jgi:hypothetical protein
MKRTKTLCSRCLRCPHVHHLCQSMAELPSEGSNALGALGVGRPSPWHLPQKPVFLIFTVRLGYCLEPFGMLNAKTIDGRQYTETVPRPWPPAVKPLAPVAKPDKPTLISNKRMSDILLHRMLSFEGAPKSYDRRITDVMRIWNV